MKSVQLFCVIALAAMPAMPALANLKTGDIAWENGDAATAIGEWRPDAIAGDPEAQVRMGQAYQIGRGVPLDLKLAEDWFHRAAQAGNAEGKDGYGLVLFQQGKRAEALPYIEDAAGRGNPRAQYVLGIALYNGDMIAKDSPRAYAMMTRAAAAGIQAAKNTLEKMDKYIPVDERTRGKALAAAFAAHAGVTSPAPISAPAPAINPAPELSRRASQPMAESPTRPAKLAVAKLVTPAPAPSGKWRVQLGALTDGSEANGAKATALWSSLHSRIAALGPYKPYIVKIGPITRLQAGPLISGAAAISLCGSLRIAKQACIPVAP